MKSISIVAITVCGLFLAGGQAMGDIDVKRAAELGFLDVTAPPFSADATGQRDSTKALQDAINHARNHCMATYFPPGTYLVSNTLVCKQGVKERRRDRAQDPKLLAMGLGTAVRSLPCLLVGSRRGKQRPRIVLAPDSPGYADPKKPKRVVHFWRGSAKDPRRAQPNGSFNQMFIGIDIEIGTGNPGAVGIRHRAAQGSGVQDCRIDATHGYCGIEGAAGSGGSHANVTVIGGQIGADLREAQPAPTITGFTLIGQRRVALHYGGYSTLTAVGLRIESDTAGPVVTTSANAGGKDLYGQLSVIDSSITFRKPGPNVAFSTQTNLYLNNTYVQGAALVAKHSDSAELKGGNPEGWLRIAEYAHGIDPPNKRLVHQYTCPVYIDGMRQDERTFLGKTEVAAPPEDLQTHHLWDDTFPGWETPGAVSVKDAPYHAVGDRVADDTAAIQRAIDENEIVFLPQGVYAVSRTLKLRPQTKLIGLHRSFSMLRPVAVEGGDFNDPANPQPVIQTADDAEAPTVLAAIGLTTGIPGAFLVHWRAGRHSIFRGVNTSCYFTRKPTPEAPALRHPMVLVSGNGGGRWYNFHSDSPGSPHSDYRHILVQGTHEPLAFYQCNPEHASSQTEMELRGARNVSIYGLKGERPTPILLIRDCDHIFVSGYSGVAIPPDGESLIKVERTPNYTIANLVDRPMGVRGDATAWHALVEQTSDERELRTAPLERPVLYKRGHPVRK